MASSCDLKAGQVRFLADALGVGGLEGASSVRNKASAYSRPACRTKLSLIMAAHNKIYPTSKASSTGKIRIGHD